MIDVLPNELLFNAFEWILVLDEPSSAYTTLCNASLVCKRWSDAAGRTLLANIEISRKQDFTSLMSLFTRFQSLPSPPSIENLTIGVGGPREPHLIDDAGFLHLLSLSPRMRKLTLLHANSMGCLPDGVLPLPFLTDVTITSAGTAPAPATEATLIQRLPPSVKALELPGSERTRFVDNLSPPNVQLEKLSIQDFPSPTSKWVLTHSEESLRALSVVYLSDVAQIPSRVQSLKVLGRLSNQASATGLGSLKELQNLEIRDASLKSSFVSTLPSSLRTIRFWSEGIAAGLMTSLTGGELPNLEHVTLDHHLSTFAAEALSKICAERGIAFVAQERRDAGRRVVNVRSLLPFHIL